MAAEAGRKADDITLAYWAMWYRPGEQRTTDTGERMVFTGTDQDVIDDIHRFRDLGVGHILISAAGSTLDKTRANMDRFADRIMARL